MDPIFGFPALKETKAEEEARNRNRMHERRLSSQFLQLENELDASRLRIIKQKQDAYDLIRMLKPRDKHVVCPFGLNQDEKTTQHKLRRGSVPSISLEEFDKQFKEFREHETERRKGETEKRFRKKLKSYFPENSVPQIINVQECTNATLLRHKNKIKDMTCKLETLDIALKDQDSSLNKRKCNALTLPLLTGIPSCARWFRRRHTVASLSGNLVNFATPRILTKNSSDSKLNLKDTSFHVD